MSYIPKLIVSLNIFSKKNNKYINKSNYSQQLHMNQNETMHMWMVYTPFLQIILVLRKRLHNDYANKDQICAELKSIYYYKAIKSDFLFNRQEGCLYNINVKSNR